MNDAIAERPTRATLSIIERAVFDRIRRLPLEPGTRVLDAPCGLGALTLSLLDSGLDAWGTDVNPAASDSLGERFRSADLGAGIPFADRHFQLVASVEGVEHLENPFAFLREVRRVLRPGGRLVLTTPNTASVRSRVRFFGSGFYNQDPRPLDESARRPQHHISLRTLPEWRYALHTAGLALTEVGHTHIKPVSFLYGIYAPWIAAYTTIAFRKEKDPAQRERNRDIRRALLSRSALFGENLLFVATRLD